MCKPKNEEKRNRAKTPPKNAKFLITGNTKGKSHKEVNQKKGCNLLFPKFSLLISNISKSDNTEPTDRCAHNLFMRFFSLLIIIGWKYPTDRYHAPQTAFCFWFNKLPKHQRPFCIPSDAKKKYVPTICIYDTFISSTSSSISQRWNRAGGAHSKGTPLVWTKHEQIYIMCNSVCSSRSAGNIHQYQTCNYLFVEFVFLFIALNKQIKNKNNAEETRISMWTRIMCESIAGIIWMKWLCVCCFASPCIAALYWIAHKLRILDLIESLLTCCRAEQKVYRFQYGDADSMIFRGKRLQLAHVHNRQTMTQAFNKQSDSQDVQEAA